MHPHDFGWALEKMRDGQKVQRIGWNGKDMWIVLIDDWACFQGLSLPKVSSFIGMKTADDKFVPWLASQTDLLATDWVTVE